MQGVVSARVAVLDQDPPTEPTGVGAAPVTEIGPLGKPVGAVVAAAKVLRALHVSERPLNASEIARAAGLHRGTAYNILRTLQAERFVGYNEVTRT
jgi:IclR helix-turn-helix domain